MLEIGVGQSITKVQSTRMLVIGRLMRVQQTVPLVNSTCTHAMCVEQHLIVLHIPFMKMLVLPKGGRMEYSQYTYELYNYERSIMEGSLIQVKMKLS